MCSTKTKRDKNILITMKGWKDITLRKAIDLMNVKTEERDALDLIIEQVSILTGKTENQVELMSPKELIEMTETMFWMKTLPKAKATKVIKINGREYGLVDLERICLAQMIDIEEYYALGLNEYIEKILSVLYLPIKKRLPLTNKYTLEEYEPSAEREEDMLDCDMETMWGTALFFYRGVREYSLAMMAYLEGVKKKRTIELEVMRLQKMMQEEGRTEM